MNGKWRHLIYFRHVDVFGVVGSLSPVTIIDQVER